jgi:ABC-2 type transport system permease protein
MNRQRVFAIVERELRKFVRTPMILFMTLLMPLMQLFVLGNAFGGRATHLVIAVVDEDGGPASRRGARHFRAGEQGDMVRPASYD